MTTLTETLISEIRTNMSLERQHETELLESNNRIEVLLSNLLGVNKNVTEKYLVTGYTIDSQGHYEVSPVGSAEYERARIFVSVGFNENTSAGIAIDLYYAGHRIGEIITVSPTEAGMSAGSEAFDINQLSGFNLIIRNKDVDQAVVINSLKIVLYNE